MEKNQLQQSEIVQLPKTPTGIVGLDEITYGGLPKGRPTLVAGSAGAGKTLLATEFLFRGATEFGEPGVFMAFEETADDLKKNVKSLGFDLDTLIKEKKIYIDHVRVERSEIEETGEYDLEGLFIRLDLAIKTVGAKRVVLDTIESLFSGLTNASILRAEIRRLFNWLKDKGMTTVITGERGDATITRQGLEEYVSDCVIILDHRIVDQISTRQLRVVKYRGSLHGTNEYPFLIDENGISVLPITSLNLNHSVSTERVSSGIERLDTMLSGKGFYKGSTILVSGTAGAGKSSLAAYLAKSTCQNGKKVLYFAFEESPNQIIRNMKSIGLDLEPFLQKGLLKFQASRSTLYGLEMHLVTMHKLVQEFQPDVVIIDPMTNLIATGSRTDVRSMLTRIIDFLKSKQITTMLISLTRGGETSEQTEVEVSSLVDTWLLLREIETNGERNRGLYVLKSRGMAHSDQIREFLITSHGIDLVDVYLGQSGVLTGTARLAQEAREKAQATLRQQEIEKEKKRIVQKEKTFHAHIEALRAEFEADKEALERAIKEQEMEEKVFTENKHILATIRNADKE